MLLRTTSDLAALVRERRRELGLTQDALARLADLRRATVADLEAGRSRPSFDSALAVLAALGIGLDAWTPNIVTAPRSRRAPVDLDEVLAEVRRP